MEVKDEPRQRRDARSGLINIKKEKMKIYYEFFSRRPEGDWKNYLPFDSWLFWYWHDSAVWFLRVLGFCIRIGEFTDE